MSKIAIDARNFGPKHTGIGRYVQNLLDQIALTKFAKNSSIYLIVNKNQQNEIRSRYQTKFKYLPTTIAHYSFAEQLFLPFLLYSNNFDLVHFTQFNKPFLYFKKSVLTIHDLIKHLSKGRETTTKSPLLYWPKYLAYKLLTDFNIQHNPIIVPSNYWRKYILDSYKISPSKIITTYEALDPTFLNNKKIIVNPDKYLVYTGNVYPHKNIQIVFQALHKLPNFRLKIICARSVFLTRIENKIKQLGIQKQVDILGYVPDQEFIDIYQHATALVHPSLIEGFSLTGLEAMALNCPVISSNASCMPEIYQDSVLYFDPKKPDDLIEQIKSLSDNPKLRQDLIQKGKLQIKKYSWATTAKQTTEFYDRILQQT